MTRTRVRRRRLAASVIAAAAWAAWAGPVGHAVAGSQAAPVASHSYVVRSGDTLWSIASALSPGADPRPVVDAIAEANHVDPGALVPGQTLAIPGGA